MASSAINALNNFASAHLRAYIDRIISEKLISEENAMRVFAEMDTAPVPKRRTDVAIPGSPSGYTDEYLEGVSGVVLRNIGQLNGITGIKQSGRQNKAEMVKIIKAHFEPAALPSLSAALPVIDAEVAEVAEPKKKEKEKPKKKEKEKAEPKEKKAKEKKEKKQKNDASSSEDELRADAIPKRKEKKEKEKKPDEDDGIEAEMWESPNGMTFLRDKDNNLYDKGTQELVGTWDEDAEEVIPA